MFYLIVVVLLAGLTGSARLNLKAHTPLEVYSGFILGFGAVFLTMFFY
jgi:membrane-associated phospholipid phosphatase